MKRTFFRFGLEGRFPPVDRICRWFQAMNETTDRAIYFDKPGTD